MKYMNIMYSLSHRKRSILFILSFLLILVFSPTNLISQESLSWEALADITYTKEYDEEFKTYWLVPIFGKQPKAYQHKIVILEGYFIPLDSDGNFNILSRYPYSSCFFCGKAGPESVVELQMDKKLVKDIRMDERVRFQGELILNRTDYDHCNYILKAARPLKEKP